VLDVFVAKIVLQGSGIDALARELKLPDPDKPSQFLWPPPQPNWALQMITTIRPDPFLAHEAAKGTYIEAIEARNKRILEDNRRQIEEAERSQREFEKQKAAETEAAKERDRQAYAERGWPSG
jgi:hypothetical protein